jgi:hypothetical protein
MPDAVPQQPAHRVLLVRDWDEQTTGSGCCGRLGSATSELGCATDFAPARELMEQMGAIYRALRAELAPELCDIQVVDARNITFLYPSLYLAARRRGLARRAAFGAIASGVRQGAIIVDGVTVSAGGPPPVDEAVDLVLRSLAAATRGRTPDPAA